MFGGVWHEGTVKYVVTPENWFNIVYDDGDGEDVHPRRALEMHESLRRRNGGQSPQPLTLPYPPTPFPRQAELIGRRVGRMFGAVWHEGVVESFVTPENWFNIAYDDGDGEDVHPWRALEMHECLLQRHEGQSLPTHRFCSENEEKSDARFHPLFFGSENCP